MPLNTRFHLTAWYGDYQRLCAPRLAGQLFIALLGLGITLAILVAFASQRAAQQIVRAELLTFVFIESNQGYNQSGDWRYRC